MYAIVDIAGQQFKVEKGKRVYVNRLAVNEGEKVTFDKVLLTQNESDIRVGKPVVEGVSISATVEKHMKGDKLLVFKKKRRKGYKKLNGHRQYLTQITIDDITFGNDTSKSKVQVEVAEEETTAKIKTVVDEAVEKEQTIEESNS